MHAPHLWVQFWLTLDGRTVLLQPVKEMLDADKGSGTDAEHTYWKSLILVVCGTGCIRSNQTCCSRVYMENIFHTTNYRELCYERKKCLTSSARISIS
jgi:hypothetical protein